MALKAKSKPRKNTTRRASRAVGDESTKLTRSFKLTIAKAKLREGVYNDLDHMIEERNRTRHQFNGPEGDRNLIQYINDSDKRLNANTPTRAEQGKEEWQANVFNPITRSKLKAIVASVALAAPEQSYTAVNKEGLYSSRRAEFIKQMVRHSRNTENTAMDIFFEAWEAAGKGTVVKYDGYLKTKYKRKYIKKFDAVTGECEFDEREEVVDDKPIDIQVPLNEFFIWDFKIFNVQDQPKIAWVKNYNRYDLEMEFGHYPNFKYVKDAASVKKFQSTVESYYTEAWMSRVADQDDYEVIRYYNILEDRYEIWINGVDILLAPILLGRGKKLYPFSKTIFEPFSDKAYFYGASLPGLLQGNQDIDNTMWNTILDKLYRSLKKPILVGLANKDAFDLEDELVDQDNKIYVPDINQVKEMPFEGVSNGDMAMLQLASRYLDMQSVDQNQQGIQGKGVTAREILVADENARKLKGIFFMFLEDLWLQKTKLRIPNLLMNYMRVKQEAVIGADGVAAFKDITTIYNVKDTKLSDGTTGTLGIQIVRNKEKLPPVSEIEAKEAAMTAEGMNYKLIAVTQDYLDDWNFDFQVTTDSVFSSDKLRKAAEVDEKQTKMAQFYPEYFVANKEKNFAEFIGVYGESSEDYKKPAPPAPPQPTPGQGGGASPLDQGAAALDPLAAGQGQPQ